MKRLLSLFFAVLICLTLTACIGTLAEATDNTDKYAMELVERFTNGFYIFREPVTDVLYMRYSLDNAGGITVMLDPETGLPLTYTKYLEQYTEMFQEDGE